MKAMILAAGLGTRLRPLTDSLPKALVPLAGKPLLAHVIERLRAAGVDEIIINVHHFAEMIMDYVKQQNRFGIRIEFSREETLLNTGGGLKQAAWFFDDGRPFFLHNVDVLTDLDLQEMLAFHQRKQPLATLAVRDRKTSRYLLFDEEGRLAGWRSLKSKKEILARKVEAPLPLSFMGIHVISPRLLERLQEEGAFSIVDAYLRLAAEGETILGYRGDRARWMDLGRLENLQAAEKHFPL